MIFYLRTLNLLWIILNSKFSFPSSIFIPAFILFLCAKCLSYVTTVIALVEEITLYFVEHYFCSLSHFSFCLLSSRTKYISQRKQSTVVTPCGLWTKYKYPSQHVKLYARLTSFPHGLAQFSICKALEFIFNESVIACPI